jgi:hypothetical protein
MIFFIGFCLGFGLVFVLQLDIILPSSIMEKASGSRQGIGKSIEIQQEG